MHSMDKSPPLLAGLALAFLALLQSGILQAGTLNVQVEDQDAEAVEDAVVFVRTVNSQVPAFEPMQSSVDQVDKAFVPFVRVVTAGSEVSFPNSDDIRHHVYSFADARTFELPLYIGTPANPVQFDQAGAVDLGCNIHDFMRGYIYIVETPFFSKSVAGDARLEALPEGDLELVVWHPRLTDDQPVVQNIQLSADAEESVSVRLELRGERGTGRAPKRRRNRY